MPKISVIMGVYNCKSFDMLKKSVESIINQTFTDWEFIICDDGSTNNTTEMLEEIKKLDSRIKVVGYKENKGLHTALNTCIAAAHGEYIARQDDDDISEPHRFEEQMKFISENPQYDIVGADAVVFDEQGEWGKYEVVAEPQKKDFLWNNPFIHPVTIMKKASLDKVGGYRASKETRILEDYDLFMRMYAQGMKGANIQEYLYQYRVARNINKKRRPMKERINEAKVRYKGFKAMGISVKGIPYVVKPVILGLIPTKIFNKITEKKYK